MPDASLEHLPHKECLRLLRENTLGRIAVIVDHRGWSVLVRGTLHHVDADAADFRERFDPEPLLLAERDAWLAIQPFAISGRRLHPTTTEWAFHARAYL